MNEDEERIEDMTVNRRWLNKIVQEVADGWRRRRRSEMCESNRKWMNVSEQSDKTTNRVTEFEREERARANVLTNHNRIVMRVNGSKLKKKKINKSETRECDDTFLLNRRRLEYVGEQKEMKESKRKSGHCDV